MGSARVARAGIGILVERAFFVLIHATSADGIVKIVLAGHQNQQASRLCSPDQKRRGRPGSDPLFCDDACQLQIHRIDQALIGQLQLRDRRQTHERERHKGRVEFAAESCGGGI